MLHLPTPDSNGEDNRPTVEFNHCHGANDGKFCDTAGSTTRKPGTVSTKAARSASYAQKVHKVDNVEEGVRRILKGQAVELQHPKLVGTVLTKLAAMATEAKRLGKDAPNYDLCKVTVPGSNLFCHERLRTAEHPQGIPRIQMPQFSGTPVPGSPASKLPPREAGSKEVDASEQFLAHVKSLGFDVEDVTVPAAHLKATQAQLIGSKVAGMMTAKGYDPGGSSIFVSKDHYVIDGHHRWAAVVGRDSLDGRLGDDPMRVLRINAPISVIYHLSMAWTKEFGIKGVGA